MAVSAAMGGALLEREAELAVLAGAVAAAQQGQGAIVLVTGEAGIGKTTVVRAFADATRDARLILLRLRGPQ